MANRVRDWMTLRDIAKYFSESTGLECKESKVLRWMKVGKLSPAKIKYKLRYEVRYRTHFSRKVWVDEFIRNITESDLHYGN